MVALSYNARSLLERKVLRLGRGMFRRVLSQDDRGVEDASCSRRSQSNTPPFENREGWAPGLKAMACQDAAQPLLIVGMENGTTYLRGIESYKRSHVPFFIFNETKSHFRAGLCLLSLRFTSNQRQIRFSFLNSYYKDRMVPGVLSSRYSWRHVMMRRLLVGVSVMFALIALACVTANAQAASGNNIGTLTDSTGAAVPNAEVTVTALGKG